LFAYDLKFVHNSEPVESLAE